MHAPEYPHLLQDPIRPTIARSIPKSFTFAENLSRKMASPCSSDGLSKVSGHPLFPKSLTCEHFAGKIRSRKTSPFSCAAPSQPGSKNLTSHRSEQENPDSPPEKAHLCTVESAERAFSCAKQRPAPGNPHTKSARSPVKSHLSPNLLKRRAESTENTGPEKPHLCKHRTQTGISGTAGISWQHSPANAHL